MMSLRSYRDNHIVRDTRRVKVCSAVTEVSPTAHSIEVIMVIRPDTFIRSMPSFALSAVAKVKTNRDHRKNKDGTTNKR